MQKINLRKNAGRKKKNLKKIMLFKYTTYSAKPMY